MKPVRYSKDAIRTLRRMPRPTAERIRDWRVIFEDGAVVAVIRIGPRGGVYD